MSFTTKKNLKMNFLFFFSLLKAGNDGSPLKKRKILQKKANFDE